MGTASQNQTPVEAYRDGPGGVKGVMRVGQQARDGNLDTSRSGMASDDTGPSMPTKEGLVTRARQMGRIEYIGGAIVGAFMIIVVLSMIYQLDIVQEADGPFGNLTETFVDYGVAALSLVGVGLVLLGANYAMGMFGNNGGR